MLWALKQASSERDSYTKKKKSIVYVSNKNAQLRITAALLPPPLVT